jgi:hypothetical protein
MNKRPGRLRLFGFICDWDTSGRLNVFDRAHAKRERTFCQIAADVACITQRPERHPISNPPNLILAQIGRKNLDLSRRSHIINGSVLRRMIGWLKLGQGSEEG